jgi:hypothetical protein
MREGKYNLNERNYFPMEEELSIKSNDQDITSNINSEIDKQKSIGREFKYSQCIRKMLREMMQQLKMGVGSFVDRVELG